MCHLVNVDERLLRCDIWQVWLLAELYRSTDGRLFSIRIVYGWLIASS